MNNQNFAESSTTLKYLEKRINKIDNWVDRNLSCFQPLVADCPKGTDYRRKAFGEAGLYIYVAAQYEAFGSPTALVESYWQTISCNDYLDLARRNLSTYGLYAFPVAVAKSLGKSTEKLDAYFEDTYLSTHLRSIELPPFRLMDNLFFAKMYGLSEMPYSVEEVNKLTNMNRLPDPIQCDEAQAYALTHNIFYLTGMKVNHDFLGLEPTYGHLQLQALEALFVRYMANNNLDLALELLMCLILTGLCKRWHLQYALDLVDKNLIDHTIVPGPGEPEGFEKLSETSDEFQTWVKHYHTMLVAGMTFRLAATHIDSIWARGPSLSYFAAYASGQLVRLLNDYNLPLALTVLKTLEEQIPDIRRLDIEYILTFSLRFIEQQCQADGKVGFYYDQYHALTTTGKTWEEAVDTIQVPLLNIHRQINWQQFDALAS